MRLDSDRSMEEDAEWVASRGGREAREPDSRVVILAERMDSMETYLTHQREQWLSIVSKTGCVLLLLLIVMLLLEKSVLSHDTFSVFLLLAALLAGVCGWMIFVGREGWRLIRTDKHSCQQLTRISDRNQEGL